MLLWNARRRAANSNNNNPDNTTDDNNDNTTMNPMDTSVTAPDMAHLDISMDHHVADTAADTNQLQLDDSSSQGSSVVVASTEGSLCSVYSETAMFHSNKFGPTTHTVPFSSNQSLIHNEPEETHLSQSLLMELNLDQHQQTLMQQDSQHAPSNHTSVDDMMRKAMHGLYCTESRSSPNVMDTGAGLS